MLDLQTIPECDLGFLEFNTSQPSTILFIHGALSSPLEPTLVVPHLSNYHILIPALHTNVKNLTPRPPFSIAHLTTQLATLIRLRARNSHATIYGHSLGANLALNLALSHPDTAPTVIASGIPLVSHWPWWKRTFIAQWIYLEAVLPRSTLLSKAQQVRLFNFGMKPASDTIAEEWLEQPGEGDWALCREMAAELCASLMPGEGVPLKARVLMVAGTGPMSGDLIGDVKWVVGEVRRAGGEARGVEIKEGGHPWLLQLPELCADLIKAWIEGRELPEGATHVI